MLNVFSGHFIHKTQVFLVVIVYLIEMSIFILRRPLFDFSFIFNKNISANCGPPRFTWQSNMVEKFAQKKPTCIAYDEKLQFYSNLVIEVRGVGILGTYVYTT